MTSKQRILDSLADEARATLRTTTIDLDSFLALSGEQRACRWRSWDRAAKWQACALMLTRKYGAWDDELVEAGIAAYDARWGTEPLTSEAAVMAALERLADENAGHARVARRAGETEDARYFQRAANAYLRAAEEWRKGVRPERTTAGGWRLPSRSDGQPHLLTMDGDWVCSCKAGASMHWASALIIGMEVAYEDLDRFDGGDAAEEGTPATFIVTTIERQTITLGARIAQARQPFMEVR